MKLSTSIIQNEELKVLLENRIKRDLILLRWHMRKFDITDFFNNLICLIRSIDELINLSLELDENILSDLENIIIDLRNKSSLNKLSNVISKIDKIYGKEPAKRIYTLIVMLNRYSIENKSIIFSSLSSFNTIWAILQSTRKYFIVILKLLPRLCKGKIKFNFDETINILLPIFEDYLVPATTQYYNLLMYHSLDDFKITSNGFVDIPNYDLSLMEKYYLEPEQGSIMDVIEFRNSNLINYQPNSKENKIIYYQELFNDLELIKSCYNKYTKKGFSFFDPYEILLNFCANYLIEDYHLIIKEEKINELIKQISIKSIFEPLLESNTKYFIMLDSVSPFFKIGEDYYSNIMLLKRFIYCNTIERLSKEKSFQINSGFIFEDKLKDILNTHGFIVQNNTKRIQRKEFDLVTVKNNKIYNFQCKNNLFLIHKSNFSSIEKISKTNKYLVKYYRKSLLKEKSRENLLINKLGIQQIEHFVVSRFPVVCRDSNIISFVDLNKKLKLI